MVTEDELVLDSIFESNNETTVHFTTTSRYIITKLPTTTSTKLFSSSTSGYKEFAVWKYIIIGAVVGAFLVLTIITIICVAIRRKKKHKNREYLGEIPQQKSPKTAQRVSYDRPYSVDKRPFEINGQSTSNKRCTTKESNRLSAIQIFFEKARVKSEPNDGRVSISMKPLKKSKSRKYAMNDGDEVSFPETYSQSDQMTNDVGATGSNALDPQCIKKLHNRTKSALRPPTPQLIHRKTLEGCQVHKSSSEPDFMNRIDQQKCSDLQNNHIFLKNCKLQHKNNLSGSAATINDFSNQKSAESSSLKSPLKPPSTPQSRNTSNTLNADILSMVNNRGKLMSNRSNDLCVRNGVESVLNSSDNDLYYGNTSNSASKTNATNDVQNFPQHKRNKTDPECFQKAESLNNNVNYINVLQTKKHDKEPKTPYKHNNGVISRQKSSHSNEYIMPDETTLSGQTKANFYANVNEFTQNGHRTGVKQHKPQYENVSDAVQASLKTTLSTQTHNKPISMTTTSTENCYTQVLDSTSDDLVPQSDPLSPSVTGYMDMKGASVKQDNASDTKHNEDIEYSYPQATGPLATHNPNLKLLDFFTQQDYCNVTFDTAVDILNKSK